MRRQDRMVTNIDEIKGILNSTRIIHLGMMDGDYPYVVPLHFGYEIVDDILYIYDLALAVSEPIADYVPGPFQLLQG